MTASPLPHPQQRLSYSWKLWSTTSFTGHLWEERAGQQAIPAWNMTMPPSSGQQWYSRWKNTIAVVIAAATPVGIFFFFKLHTQTKKCGFGLVIFWISTSWDDLCWQAWSVFLAFLNSPRQSRDISVRFHRFIILLMFVQGYKKKKSTD